MMTGNSQIRIGRSEVLSKEGDRKCALHRVQRSFLARGARDIKKRAQEKVDTS